jgi:hypothetical protein
LHPYDQLRKHSATLVSKMTRSLCAAGMLIAITAATGSAFAAEFKRCETVPKSKGLARCERNIPCGQSDNGYFGPGAPGGYSGYSGTPQCKTVTVRIPQGHEITKIQRSSNPGGWQRWLDDINRETTSDGSTVVSTGLQNCKHDLGVQICIVVNTKK